MKKIIVLVLFVVSLICCASSVHPTYLDVATSEITLDATFDVSSIAYDSARMPDVQPDTTLPPGIAMVRLIHQTPSPLVASENRLIGVRVWSTGAPIGVMKMIYYLFPSRVTLGDPGWGMGNCRLEQDGVEVMPTQAEVHAFGVQYTTIYGFLQVVAVRFRHEMLVTDQGTTFNLFCRVTRGSLMPGDELTAHFLHGPFSQWSCVNHGMLTISYPVDAQRVFGPDIYTNVGVLPCRPPLQTPTTEGECTEITYANFVWSPRTSPHHSDLDCASGGSDDWVSGAGTDDPSVMGSALVGETLRR